MKIISSPTAANRWCRKQTGPVVLVPTMGALHRGHISLVERARKLAGAEGSVVVSVFVNPTQFGPKEDFSKYPRPFEADAAACRKAGVDMIFHPSPEEMYPQPYSTYVEETKLETVLCGKSRPGHFRGVCTVVSKLFNIIQPDTGVFGEKDFQQLAILRRMVRDLNFPIKVVGMPTVREHDGLALSSRNQYLSPEERAQAPIIRQALLAASEKGVNHSAETLQNLVVERISTAPLARIDYVDVMDPETLEPAAKSTSPKLIAAAVFFGKTRLIDNILLKK